jgi:hypothetical protein
MRSKALRCGNWLSSIFCGMSFDLLSAIVTCWIYQKLTKTHGIITSNRDGSREEFAAKPGV